MTGPDFPTALPVPATGNTGSVPRSATTQKPKVLLLSLSLHFAPLLAKVLLRSALTTVQRPQELSVVVAIFCSTADKSFAWFSASYRPKSAKTSTVFVAKSLPGLPR